MEKIIAWAERILAKTEKRPILRALVMPAIITHLIMLPPPIFPSFYVFVALPGIIGRIVAHSIFHNPGFYLVLVTIIASQIAIYGICVIICIPLAPFLLRNIFYFAGLTSAFTKVIWLFAKSVLEDIVAKRNRNKK